MTLKDDLLALTAASVAAEAQKQKDLDSGKGARAATLFPSVLKQVTDQLRAVASDGSGRTDETLKILIDWGDESDAEKDWPELLKLLVGELSGAQGLAVKGDTGTIGLLSISWGG